MSKRKAGEFHFEEDFIWDGNSVPNETLNQEFMVNGNSVPSIQDGNSVRPNARDYFSRVLTRNSSLQDADEPAFAEPSADEYLSNEEKTKVWALILSGDTDVSRFAKNCIKQRSDVNGEAFTTSRLIRKIKELTGGTEPIEAYEPFVEGCLDELSHDLVEAS